MPRPISNDWRYSIEKRCRLYVTVRHAKLVDGNEGMQLQLLVAVELMRRPV